MFTMAAEPSIISKVVKIQGIFKDICIHYK
jgi:hypothetical protein